MKYLLTLITCLAAFNAALALPKGFFAPQSKLSQGNWVKVAVDDDGIYEISYEALRGMGFDNPEKVAVLGRGGAMLPINFTTLSGTVNITDDLLPVSVLHLNNKLYFYGRGVEQVAFRLASSYETKGYFTRQSKNIYSNFGYYFLTDSMEPAEMEVSAVGNTSTLTQVSVGVGKVIHEVDLKHNNSETGQLFFGEQLGGDTPRIIWDLDLHGALADKAGVMECYFYVDRNVEGRLSYGVEGSSDYADLETKTYSSTNFRAQEPYMIQTNIPGHKTSIFAQFESEYDCDISHIDYWTLTYQRSIPTLRTAAGAPLNQEYIAFPAITRGKSVAITFPEAASLMAIDISKPQNPVRHEMSRQGKAGTIKLTNLGSTPELIVFDPLRTQKQICGYEKGYSRILNQNLHAEVADGADMLIICIPALREQALRLAEVHRKYDGSKVVVATVEEVYNEFSQGVPDAMAYRSFVKAAYETANPVKNLLLLGPLAADYRGIINEKNPLECIIAYQTTPMNQLRGAQNANDFYGMMDDYFEDNALEKNTMHVGVGILPCRFESEAKTIIDKIEKYLQRSDFAYYANRILNVGGIGDNHSHDTQAIQLGTLINRLDNRSTIITPLAVDAYGHRGAHDKFFSSLEDGCIISNYYGHGGPSQLNREGDFFTISDVFKLRNSFLPFMGFAGCDLSQSDKGVRGLGEALVTSTHYGLIGAFLATRETWSGQNQDLFNLLTTNIFRDGGTSSSPAHTAPLSLGEIFARTKTQSKYNNELAYQLLCDPALKLPIVTRNVMLDKGIDTGIPGEYNTISGYVCNADGEADPNYNGEVVIRLMEPYKQLTSQDLISKDDPETTKKLDVIYSDTQVAMTVAEVKGGRFEAKLFIPAATSEFKGQIGRLHLCAYSTDLRLTAGAMHPLTYSAKSISSSEENDNTPPVVEIFEYQPADNALMISVRDNLALCFSSLPLAQGFSLKIDGRESLTAARHEATVSDNGARFSKLVPLSDLAEGTHTAVLTVSDAAGNRTTAETVFTYDPNRALFAIRLEEAAANGKATFRSVGIAPAKSDLVIMDSAGVILYRGEFDGEVMEWDTCDNQGRPLPPGLYKAYIIETGDNASKGHSATIDVPLI